MSEQSAWDNFASQLTVHIYKSRIEQALDMIQALDAQGGISPGLVQALTQTVVGRRCGKPLNEIGFGLDDFRLLPQISPQDLTRPPPYDAAALVAPAGPNYRRAEYSHIVMPKDGVVPWFKEGFDLASRDLRIASFRGATIIHNVVVTARNTIPRETMGYDQCSGKRHEATPIKKSRVRRHTTERQFNIDAHPRRIRIIERPTLFIGGERTYFACWMVHHFTKLFAVEYFDPDKIAIAIPSELWGNVVEMILSTGIREDQLIRLGPDELAVFDTLYVPTGPAFEYEHARSEALLPYDKIRATHAGDGQRGPSKVYLSRSDGVGGKQPKDEAALVALLESRGFQAIVPGKLSVAEKVAALKDAEVIVGAVGSGLFNALFAPTDGRLHLVVLAGQYHGDVTIATLPPLLNAKISIVYGDVELPGGLDVTSYQRKDAGPLAMADFDIDLAQLAEVLDKIDSERTPG